jgi:hypothetical protein
LTLLVVPVVYSMVEDVRAWLAERSRSHVEAPVTGD